MDQERVDAIVAGEAISDDEAIALLDGLAAKYVGTRIDHQLLGIAVVHMRSRLDDDSTATGG